MKKIWKMIAYLAIAAMFAALAGCSGDDSSSKAAPLEEDTSGVYVKDTSGAAVAGAKVYAIPVEDVETLAAEPITLEAGNYTAAALTVDEPLEDLVNGNFTAGVVFNPAEDFIVTDENGYAALPADAADDQGKYFIYVQPADETTHLPGGSLCREPVAIASIVDEEIEIVVSTKPSAAATFVGSSTCLACHPEQEGMTKTAHKLGFMAPGAPSGLQDPSEFDEDDGIYNMFATNAKYEAGTTVWFYDYDGTRGFDKFKTLESDPTIDDPDAVVYAKAQMSLEGGKYYVTFENVINAADPINGTADAKHEVVLTYGGGVYKQRPITAIDKSLYMLPLQYNATGDDASANRTKRVWRDYHMEWWVASIDATPGAETMTFKTIPAAGKAVDVECASCHFTGFSLAENADGTFTASGVADANGEWNPAAQEFQELNVGCETCHGPGSEHVAAAGQGVAIVTPQNLTPEREVGICIQCHSRPQGNGDEVNDCPLNEKNEMMRAGTSRADYLADYTSRHDAAAKDVWPDGHAKSHHQQGSDFLQSGKYRNGTRLLTCAGCHDIHTQGTDRHQLSGVSDNTLCLSCHALDITDHQVAKTGVNMGALGTFVKCSDCHNVKSSASGAGINPTDPFVGDSGTEYLHNDISSHVFDVPNKSVAAETGMPVPYTNTCGVCHSGAGL